jgi:hypothetical protein
VLAVAGHTRGLDVTAEIESVAAQLPPGQRVAVFGSGGALPASLPSAIAVDYDRDLLNAVSGGRYQLHHNIGVRTPLADQSADVVIVTSRLSPLWDKWGDRIMAEASRLAPDVRVPWRDAPPTD